MKMQELREAAGLSQRELGERLYKATGNNTSNNPQTRISSYEAGRNRVPLDIAIALVKILNKELTKKGSRTRAKVEDFA
jgi:transcriptional regulator with XRE-family HTH domain